VLAAAASHAQPAAEKLRAYQQHLSRIAADTHVDLSKVAEEHVQETSRTAKALADEVARVTTEETEKTLRPPGCGGALHRSILVHYRRCTAIARQ
jgi:hypothetical protein